MSRIVSDPQRIAVDRIAAGGDGLGRLGDGRVIFVRGGLPGETVDVAVTTNKRDYAKGHVVAIHEAAAARRAEPCPYVAAGCGGCSWQHVEPAAQLQLKVDIVNDALRRTAKLAEADVTPGSAVPSTAYRTTIRAAVGRHGRLGFRAAASHRVVETDSCLVAAPALSELLGGVVVEDAEEVSLRVSLASGERTALAHGGRATRWIRLPENVAIGASATLTEMVSGRALRVSAGSFFQSGPAAAELLVGAVRTAVGELAEAPAIDAYGGIGLFAATVACGPVTVVESSTSACNDARHNLDGRPQSTVVCSTVEDWEATRAAVVIADPARAGLGREGVAALVPTGAQRIVLVSCDPVSMARDTALLGDAGYHHRQSIVVDLFPNTPHVEVVTSFERASA